MLLLHCQPVQHSVIYLYPDHMLCYNALRMLECVAAYKLFVLYNVYQNYI